MKTTFTTWPLALTLIACGSVETTVTPEAQTAPVTKTNRRALNESNEQLTDSRKEALAAAYTGLDDDDFGTQNELVSKFTDEQVFAVISVSDILPVRLSRPTSLLVPAGTVSHPESPNRADEFYVHFGATQNEVAATYGPFPLLGVEGSPCGGFAGLQCDEGLVCTTGVSHPDAMGTCEVETTSQE